MEDQAKRLMETLGRNPAAIQALMRSPDGQALMRSLAGQDQGAALNRAARSAALGNTTEMVQMVSQIMQSPEGAALLERISKSIQG